MKLYFKLLLLLVLMFLRSSTNAQVYCINSLGSLYPTNTWQYMAHTQLGYYSFNAIANCNYIFTYCSSTAPSAQYSGDPYLTISSSAISGGIVVNNDLDAFKVFETLNARGVKLSTADLLKNYF